MPPSPIRPDRAQRQPADVVFSHECFDVQQPAHSCAEIPTSHFDSVAGFDSCPSVIVTDAPLPLPCTAIIANCPHYRTNNAILHLPLRHNMYRSLLLPIPCAAHIQYGYMYIYIHGCTIGALLDIQSYALYTINYSCVYVCMYIYTRMYTCQHVITYFVAKHRSAGAAS